MKQQKNRWSDRELSDRITQLHRSLTNAADRHSSLIDSLRPVNPQKWTYTEMGEPGGDAFEAKVRIRLVGRSAPLFFESEDE